MLTKKNRLMDGWYLKANAVQLSLQNKPQQSEGVCIAFAIMTVILLYGYLPNKSKLNIDLIWNYLSKKNKIAEWCKRH